MAESEIDRKIAVIFVADVVGYSKHMEKDENATFKAYGACEKILNKLLKKYKGSIFNTAGDSVLAEFPSAVNAVECAVDFQNEIKERNASDKTDTKLEFRIGINMGDVVQKDGNLLGDGVNIAARLEALSQPNGITISKSVYDLVVPKTKVTFNDLGVQKVKQNTFHAYDIILDPSHKRTLKTQPSSNTTLFAGIAAALIIAIAGFFTLNGGEETKLVDDRVLVLPFEVRSSNDSYDYLGLGTLEYLVSNLNGVTNFEILSTSISKSIFDKGLSDDEILKDYGAKFILRGSLQILNEDVRININLTDSLKKEQIWELTRTPKISEMFKVQDEILIDLLGLLGTGRKDASSSSFYSTIKSPKEVQLVMKWLEVQKVFNGEIWDEMAGISNELYEINPDGVAQNIIQAWTQYWKIVWGVSTDISPDRELGIRFADRAIELQNKLGVIIPDSFLVRSFFSMMERNPKRALEYLDLATNDSKYNQPNFWGAAGALYHFNSKHKEAIDALEKHRSQKLVPNDLNMELLGWAYTLDGNYEKAKEIFELILSKDSHRQKDLKSKIYLSMSYMYHLQDETEKSKQYFALHESMEHKYKPSLFQGSRAKIMEEPHKFWKEMGL